MSSAETSFSAIKKVYNTTVNSLKSHPAIFLPFIIFAILEFLALMLLYLTPRMPLRLIFGPIIRTFWQERFLHYPLNFLLLPKLASLSRMFLSIILGSLLTGMVVVIIFDIYNKRRLNLKTAFNSALKKYISLFFIVFIFTSLYYALAKIITIGLARYFTAGHTRFLFLGMKIWLGPILFTINFILILLIQSAFIYTIPTLIIENEKLLKSITKSFALFKNYLFPTLILVGLPILFYLPIAILYDNSAILMSKLFPEFILLVSILGIILNALIDLIITTSCTFFYLINREK